MLMPAYFFSQFEYGNNFFFPTDQQGQQSFNLARLQARRGPDCTALVLWWSQRGGGCKLVQFTSEPVIREEGPSCDEWVKNMECLTCEPLFNCNFSSPPCSLCACVLFQIGISVQFFFINFWGKRFRRKIWIRFLIFEGLKKIWILKVFLTFSCGSKFFREFRKT